MCWLQLETGQSTKPSGSMPQLLTALWLLVPWQWKTWEMQPNSLHFPAGSDTICSCRGKLSELALGVFDLNLRMFQNWLWSPWMDQTSRNGLWLGFAKSFYWLAGHLVFLCPLPMVSIHLAVMFTGLNAQYCQVGRPCTFFSNSTVTVSRLNQFVEVTAWYTF